MLLQEGILEATLRGSLYENMSPEWHLGNSGISAVNIRIKTKPIL